MEASQTLAGPTATRSATLHHLARSCLWQSPACYLPIARFRYPEPSPAVIGPATELVIEGYMRSANTFAVYAFQSAQRRPVALAHHLHAPAQLIRAARRGVPALVLIRDPEDTILSQVQWEPDISMRAALMTYVRFYRALEPYAGSLPDRHVPAGHGGLRRGDPAAERALRDELRRVRSDRGTSATLLRADAGAGQRGSGVANARPSVRVGGDLAHRIAGGAAGASRRHRTLAATMPGARHRADGARRRHSAGHGTRPRCETYVTERPTLYRAFASTAERARP